LVVFSNKLPTLYHSGRPGTIDATNYKNFLKSDGTPTSSLIVEGANLFITPDAREKLFEEAGVVICKDSSANKCGVITSSYEICAAMLLDEDEFLENKDQIVNEVLNKLKELARLEAELLFREVDIYGQSLPMISQIVSNSINNVTDALADALNALSDDERSELLVLFRSHLPDTLATLSFDRVHERVPVQYVKNAIASSLASKVVYKEGTKFIDALPKKKLAEMALNYIRKEKEVATLMEALKGSNIGDEEKAKMMELLDAGGARTALSLRK
jgi:glutamate dehydrogenase